MKRDQLIADLFETMDIAKRSMHAQMHSIINGSAISRPQLELLFTIKHGQPIGSKQLAQKLHLTPGAISQLADGLDQQQLITRQIDAIDRRKQTFSVSSKGTALLKSLDKKRRVVMEHVLQDLSDAEIATWLRIQQKLVNEFQTIHTQSTEGAK